ncbi:hypothetical protein Dred_1862 [Desulforamulus reducens MI-1]|uniref:Uncharacterized protein n=1 Tax=Desulforamulus reducens (strain ATCC BAA-1160 / DSM 100696 / MI-1) TaxID=349161 RepID=A4J5N3_DESRM|nr:hypothetical protein [Desulforamulus reducens]ABO50386.1 hypothetical protein Dred_1862 [Desulforamulus reducens MI-1]
MIHKRVDRIERKEKLIKWYGWIVILILCMTPLVIVLLPKLMLNVGRINKILRESIVSETTKIRGDVANITWNKHADGDLGCIEGDIELQTNGHTPILCKFKKYVGPKHNQTIVVNKTDKLLLTGTYEDNVFLIRKLENQSNQYVYTTEPQVSVY